MQFLSIEFLICFLLLIVLLYKCKKENTRQSILLVFSYVFYAFWDVRFLGLLLVQTAITYITGERVKRGTDTVRKRYLAVGITLLLMILGVFKYFNFFLDTFCDLFRVEHSFTLKLILPMGLSFYTFQAISYMIDVYRGKLQEKYSLKQVALYISFFPQLMSGPIVKSYVFLPQLKKEHLIQKTNLEAGVQIFLFGMVKKVVIADRLGVCVNAVYEAPNAFGWLSILIAVLSYSIQIYCDFSGYSDMAIGIARILGYDLGRNFNCPYLAKNPSDFWGRWHISLSSWFKEYLYFPLGGNRKGLFRTYFNLFVVMLVSGLWHGAAMTFIVWGCVHGIGSVVNKVFGQLCGRYRSQTKNGGMQKITSFLAWITNFTFVTLAWVLFRADSFETAMTVYRRLFTFASGVEYVFVYSLIYGVMFVLAHMYVACKNKGEAKYPVLPLNKFWSWFVLWFVILITVVLFYSGDTAFIYSQF